MSEEYKKDPCAHDPKTPRSPIPYKIEEYGQEERREIEESISILTHINIREFEAKRSFINNRLSPCDEIPIEIVGDITWTKETVFFTRSLHGVFGLRARISSIKRVPESDDVECKDH